MKNDIVLNALKRKRAEISGFIRDLESRREILVQHLGNVDATLALFAPSFDAKTIAPKRPYKAGLYFIRNELSRMTMDCLRRAEGLISRNEVVAFVIKQKGITDMDTIAAASISSRVQGLLADLHKRGLIDKLGDTRYARWKLKQPDDAANSR